MRLIQDQKIQRTKSKIQDRGNVCVSPFLPFLSFCFEFLRNKSHMIISAINKIASNANANTSSYCDVSDKYQLPSNTDDP